jgi:hypothetical protein
MAHRVRPKAHWGIWGFPLCATGAQDYTCTAAEVAFNKKYVELSSSVKKMNTLYSTSWLYEHTSAMYPDVYIHSGAHAQTLHIDLPNHLRQYVTAVYNETKK